MTEGSLAPFACPACCAPLDRAAPDAAVCRGAGAHKFPLEEGAPVFVAASPEDEAALAATAAAYSEWKATQPRAWSRQRERVWRAVIGHARQAAPPPGVFADIGAGGGGLAAMAARANYQAAAIDAAVPPPGPYVRACASMTALPFADGSLRVAAYCASLHYASDVDAALREAARALDPAGALVLALTPLHRTGIAAESAAETTRSHMRAAASEGDLAESYRHLLEADLVASLVRAGFAPEAHPSGFSATFRALRAAKERLAGEEFARFPILVARRKP